jgi:hypothetical protein
MESSSSIPVPLKSKTYSGVFKTGDSEEEKGNWK